MGRNRERGTRVDGRHRTGFLLGLVLALTVFACDGGRIGTAPAGSVATEPPFIASGDLEAIRASGTLRVLMPVRRSAARLPRGGASLEEERALATGYAAQLGLSPTWVYVDSRSDLIPSLINGRGDLIAANLTATDERRRHVSFTVPVTTVREQLVCRTGEEIGGPEDLAGRTIFVRRSSSFWESARRLREQQPGLMLELLPETVETEEAINGVALGEYDLTIADSNLLDAVRTYRDDVQSAFDLTHDRPIAWAVRPDATELLDSIDRFLTAEHLDGSQRVVHHDDLPGIRERQTLRVLTRNDSTTYFLWRGQLRGFEYELVREFARQHDLRLEVVVPPRDVDMYDWLLEGRGDLIAASETPSPDRELQGVAYTRPYNHVTQWVVAPIDFPDLTDLRDLSGQNFFVRRSSPFWDSLSDLRMRGVRLRAHPAPESLATQELIAEVALGRVGLTVADSHLLDIELSWRDDVKPLMPLREEVPLAWVTRDTSPQLLEAANRFLHREYRGLFYNITYEKYFEDDTKIRRYQRGDYRQTGQLSPYDEVVRHYAERFGFDWRLIVAQMYQESRFDPNAQSFAGAQGLLQVLPETASSLGFERMDSPDEMIHAGVRYMSWVRDRFEADLPVADRMWFTLAGYNAGTGHVREARRLARRKGLNPNRWFDNVERTMLLLQRPQYASQSRFGYCRCAEPVRYVRQIVDRYQAYLDAEPPVPAPEELPLPSPEPRATHVVASLAPH